ncbi:MAG: SRPBCC family protein [Actinomycetia bacterium]|nr:SRPBCC family protein [Actinomycetes bacterium]MCP5030455.1 SRPBCC family protein [Actinomycetes bacterium]
MHQQVTVDIDAPVEHVFPIIADLSRYPQLLDVVHRVESADSNAQDGSSDSSDSDDPVWLITLRTQIGPLARSKRLRVVRTVHQPLAEAIFERQETDDRHHSPWTLSTTLEPLSDGQRTQVTMALHYGGRLWTSLLDGVLEAQIHQATANLERLALAQG